MTSIPYQKVGKIARNSFFALVFALLVTLAAGCRRSEAPSPNIVLITVDTLRADRLNPYGYDKIETPAIGRLAREGIVFENAFCDSTWTLPSLASVMTGKYPIEHKVRSWHDRLAGEYETIAERLEKRGYLTAGIVGSCALDRHFGFDQGFDSYDDEMNKPLFLDPDNVLDDPALQEKGTTNDRWLFSRLRSDAYRPDNEVADRAIAWLDHHDQHPFFLWVHFFGPHEKERPPKGSSPQWVAAQIAAYDPAVEFADQQVGRLLERISSDPRNDQTVILFHSDHGQSLNEHGIFGHGTDLYDTTAHVPLIVRLPQQARAGERVRRLVRNLDIFPTILRLANAGSAGATDGHDLLSAGGSPLTYLETYQLLGFAHDQEVGGKTLRIGPTLRGLRSLDWKLIVRAPLAAGPPPGDPVLPADFVASERKIELFHVSSDAAERHNLADARTEQVGEMLQTLDRFVDTPRRNPWQPAELDEAAKERLRSIGYLDH